MGRHPPKRLQLTKHLLLKAKLLRSLLLQVVNMCFAVCGFTPGLYQNELTVLVDWAGKPATWLTHTWMFCLSPLYDNGNCWCLCVMLMICHFVFVDLLGAFTCGYMCVCVCARVGVRVPMCIKFNETREVLFYKWHKKKPLLHADGYYWSHADRYYWTQYFDTNPIDLDFDSRSLECEKPIILQNFSLIWMESGILLRLGVMNLIPILSRPSNIQGRTLLGCDLLKELKHWLVFGHLQTSFFQRCYGDRDH